jgi:hypothetical protein
LAGFLALRPQPLPFVGPTVFVTEAAMMLAFMAHRLAASMNEPNKRGISSRAYDNIGIFCVWLLRPILRGAVGMHLSLPPLPCMPRMVASVVPQVRLLDLPWSRHKPAEGFHYA